MSLKSTEEILDSVVQLEDAVEALDIEIGKLVQAAYLSALREHTSMQENEIFKKWLNYNAREDNLKV